MSRAGDRITHDVAAAKIVLGPCDFIITASRQYPLGEIAAFPHQLKLDRAQLLEVRSIPLGHDGVHLSRMRFRLEQGPAQPERCHPSALSSQTSKAGCN